MQTAQSIGLPDSSTEAQRLLAISNFDLDKATENLMVAYVGVGGSCARSKGQTQPGGGYHSFHAGARRGAEALFIHAVRPVMPQPQNDGSLQGGNLEVFESLLNDPVVLSPPRAETFVRRHIKPADGMWTQEAMEAARTVFAWRRSG